MLEFTITYQGGLHCEAVHGPSGARIETDAPVDNHGKGAAFSPTDLCSTSLGVCMMTVMGIYAQKHNVELTGTTLKVRKVMTAEPPRKIARIEVDFDIPLPADHPHREALEHAAITCPVALSLHPDIEKPVSFRWVG
jgi:uncharacterized OsmC-like protein